MSLPFAIIDADGYFPPVLLGYSEEDGIIGLEFPSGDLWEVHPEDIVAGVTTENAAVFGCIRAAWTKLVWGERAVANRSRKKFPKFVARGHDFPLLPAGVLSGFPAAASTIRRHRDTVPSLDTIIVSSLFAVSTVRTSIEQAELSFDCFGKLYNARTRTMPPVEELKSCFRGLQNSKSSMFSSVADYASEIQKAIKMGYQDRELRSVLALESELPTGLGLAKLSFTLALLGHDCICLDGRLLSVLFKAKDKRAHFEKMIGKNEGAFSDRALLTYEAAEDAFLKGNPHYDANDPLGRARAQWLSWEGVGGKGAEHRVWLDLLQSEEVE